MTTLATTQDDMMLRMMSVLRRELAPFPGRMDAVWRYVLSCAIVVMVSMTLQVPFLALSVIMVFFAVQENTFLTRKAAVGLIIGSTLAVITSLLLIKFAMDYPFWRILCACGVCFAGMYFMRISKLGTIGYLLALFVIYMQSLVDVIDNPEALTRALLWVWVAITYPIIVSVLVSVLLKPAHAGRVFNDAMLRQLDDIAQQLDARLKHGASSSLSSDVVEQATMTLRRLLGFAIASDAAYARNQSVHLTRVGTIVRLRVAAAQLSRQAAKPLSEAQRAVAEDILLAVAQLRQALMSAQSFSFKLVSLDRFQARTQIDATLIDMVHALHALDEFESGPQPELPKRADRSIVADAFSNPVYAQFAFKSTLAAMICYVFYTAVQWPGIHTSMLTCIILALPTLGATTHKGLLRVVGCALGSLISLWAIVFVMPQLDSVLGLLALTLPVVAVSAWIASGSPRSNYIGVQIVFAFALALLGRFAPTTDLTEIRDRMVGILVGVVVVTIVFAVMWPERDSAQVRLKLSTLLAGIADLIKVGLYVDDKQSPAAIERARTAAWSLLAENRELQSRVMFENGWRYARDEVDLNSQSLLASAQEALFAIDGVRALMHHAGHALPATLVSACSQFRDAILHELESTVLAVRGTTLPVKETRIEDAYMALEAQCKDAGRDAELSRLVDEISATASVLHERMLQLVNHSRALSS